MPSPKTLFKGDLQAAAGPPDDDHARRRRSRAVLELGAAASAARREAELVEEYQDLLEDAVRLQLRSDVPLGLFLSSGVDSGACWPS